MRWKHKTKTFADTVYSPQTLIQLGEGEPEFYLSKAGHFEGTGHFHREYVLPYHSIHYWLRGPSFFNLDGEDYLLEPGDLLVIFPEQVIHVNEKPDHATEHLWFDLEGSKVDVALDSVGMKRGDARTRLPQSVMLPLSRTIHDTYMNSTVPVCKAVRYAWELLDAIEHATGGAGDEHIAAHDTASESHRLIHQGYRSGITINQLADHFGCSRATIYRKFKEKYSESPKVYLDRIRFDYAMQLLENTTLTLKEVSHSAGYENIQSFHFQFRKRRGITPGQWRREGPDGT